MEVQGLEQPLFTEVMKIHTEEGLFVLLAHPKSQKSRLAGATEESFLDDLSDDVVDSSVCLGTDHYHCLLSGAPPQSLEVFVLNGKEVGDRFCFACTWRPLDQKYAGLLLTDFLDDLHLRGVSGSLDLPEDAGTKQGVSSNLCPWLFGHRPAQKLLKQGRILNSG